ncbi:hypothetical protein JXO52_01795 [bacterium]|nr:hypothetical protein [bacterium]
MKAKTLLLVLGFLVFPSLVFSQALKIGAGSIYNISNNLVKHSAGYDFKLLYQAQRRIAILTSFGHYSTDMGSNLKNVSDQPYTYDFLRNHNDKLIGGDLALSWIEFNPIYYLLNNSSQTIKIFCGVGLGIYFVKNEWSPDIYDQLLLSREQTGLIYFEKRRVMQLGYNVRIGFDLPATSKSHFCFEVKYLVLNPEFSYTIREDEMDLGEERKRSINLNTISFGLSLIVTI